MALRLRLRGPSGGATINLPAGATVAALETLARDTLELGAGAALPYLQLSVCQRGVLVSPHKTNTCPTQDCGLYPIDTISYGVQDLVYTRVFAMIVVKVGRD